MVRTEFNIQISKENVCRMLCVSSESEIYEEVLTEIEKMIPEACEKIRPISLLEFGDFDREFLQGKGRSADEALYVINSLGKEISAWSSQLFLEENYLGQMLADAIADDYLFQMDEVVKDTAVCLCRERKRGIVRRLEAPGDVSMQVQKKAFDVTGAGRIADLRITESYMFDPVKTICQVYLLDRDASRFNAEHNCGGCGQKDCPFRNIPMITITIKDGKQERKIRGKKGESLLEILRGEGVLLSAVCGGNGVCGKCRIRVEKGNIPVSGENLRLFSAQELEAGCRLACHAYPESDCTVWIREPEEDFIVQAEDRDEEIPVIRENAEYGIAADIGTTTIAMQLVELPEGRTAGVYTCVNRQRIYGADVISRIEASVNGKGKELKQSIRSMLMEGIEKLTDSRAVQIKRLVIGGNTTMIHLLMGYSCETLGVYPFTPVNIRTIHMTERELFGKQERGFDVVICPGISVYVGGDIVAGLYALDFQKRKEVSVLVDLGTNGELAVGNRERILTASAAAGPAFEGGNIICGIGSVPGAICQVEIKDRKIKTETIGGALPIGICGTGVVDTVYALMKEGIVDETGRMEDAYFDTGVALTTDGEIRFYQKDVREIQLAKSAVRAALETLIERYGVNWEEIETIYVAGGFGHKMDIRKAIGIGLFPDACRGKIKAVGNTCLKGAAKYLTAEKPLQEILKLTEVSEEINLSTDKTFQELYIDYMYFDELQ